MFTWIATLALLGPSVPTAQGAPVELFNGKDLTGWTMDVPALDNDPNGKVPFIVRDGKLVSLGTPGGHLLTTKEYRDYKLTVVYRFTGRPGNCGVLVHASKLRRLSGMFPQSMECQMQSGDAGDFWCIGEDIVVPNMEIRRGPREKWGVDGDKNRRIVNLTDNSEKPLGEWNTMVIRCKGRDITIWVNGDLVNDGHDCTADHGKIALQAEGTEVEFKSVTLENL
ncbi:MAG: DUF1080 domain-containing protein [Fimbriimonadaceae bacterium]|nr:DUF1080 domain-containing protein [Fimbriimonadaceae bacterium]